MLRVPRALARGRREEGQSAVEAAALVPWLLIVVLIVLQGLGAAVGVSQVRAAADDGARALEEGRPAHAAVAAAVSGHVRLESVSGCGNGCVHVTGSVPIGIPGVVEVTRLHVSAEATYPTRRP
ncbi:MULTISPECIES: TadE/TadG family type IV pilus assembly protein [unclassified Actinomyces]|nr:MULTISPECIES: TadE/TadG family type IV pilus assembly protein [unclassified Actinomyces]MCL3777077.1 pilus assembly protein [Actinomyces sp. AC-20-1]